MPGIRRGVHEAASASLTDFHVALGQTYVSPEAAREHPRVFDADRAQTLHAWVETLIPADQNWPSAAETDAVGYIEATAFAAAPLRPLLIGSIDAVVAATIERFGDAARFAALSLADRQQILATLEEKSPAGFQLVLELTFEAYYRDERVIEITEHRTGFSMRRAMVGWELEPFDESQLDRVRRLPPRFRVP